jgi:uncharacterized SAM-binding protein YcdF (DUF218 family)
VLAFLKTLATWIGVFLMGVTALPPSWYAAWLARPWTAAHAPVLIVLGGDSVREGIMGLSSYWRCVYALDVWRESGARSIVLSGDAETTASMRSWLIAQGVPASAFTVENRSHSTRENALFTAELLRGVPGPYLLLTSDIHVWRASRCFTKAGLAVLPRPAPDAFKRGNDWRDRWRVFLDVSTECGKIGYYKSKGWI